MSERAAESDVPAMREEWRSLVTLVGESGGSVHTHSSREDAEQFRRWREGAEDGLHGMMWPAVTIELQHRYVTDWTRVTPPGVDQ